MYAADAVILLLTIWGVFAIHRANEKAEVV